MLTIDGDRVTDIRGDADDVLSRGHLCPKALALREIHEECSPFKTGCERTTPVVGRTFS
jgi:hypothetical protein